MKKRIYLAGPYSADNVMDVLHNIGRGIKVAAKILKDGDYPFVPWIDFHFALQDQSIPKQAFYEYSLAWMEVADEVWVLPNSENSVGTQKEIERAKELNIPIKYLCDVKKDEIVKCDDCGAVATIINEVNPYLEEIDGEIEYGNWCEDCYQNKCDDI